MLVVMRANHATWALFLLAVPLSACASAPKGEVANVARHDLRCDQVEVSEIASGRYGVYGCGRGAVYTQTCEGQQCRWGRLRHGHEASVSASEAAARAPQSSPQSAPREVVPPPPPVPREVVPPPASEAREVVPAPPPAQGESTVPSSGGETPVPQQGDAPAGGDTTQPPAPLPLSAGELTEPYQAEVPAQPTVQRTVYPPPMPLVDYRPPPPAPDHVWVSGYWSWGGARWYWLPGYWCPPRVGFVYMPGRWYWSSGFWWYGPGGWAYPGSTVVVHHVAPRPHRVATVRAFTPTRVSPSQGYGVVRASPARGNGVVRAPAAGSFRPSNSPLYRYPTGQGSQVVRGSPRTYGTSRGTVVRPSTGGVGRVVRPGETVRRMPNGASRSSVVSPMRSPSYSPSMGSPSRVPAMRSAPIRSMPSRSFAPSRSFSPSRGMGGSPSRGMGGPVRVSPSRR